MRRSTLSATAIAFVPLRLATAMVTAGRNWRSATWPSARTRRLLAAVGDVGHVAQEHRLAVRHADHDVAHIVVLSAGTRRSRAEYSRFRWNRTCRIRAAGWTSPARRPPGRASGCTPARRPGRAPPRTSRRWPPIIVTAETSGDCLMTSCDLRRHAPQLEIAVALAPQRQRQNRHIVDRARLDQRRRRARRDQIEVRGELLVQPDDALLLVLADVEAHDRHRHPGLEVE